MRKAILIIIALNVFCLSLNAQVVTKKNLEDDFEKYKREQSRDFDDFKQKREEELRRMQKEYQDYYDSMTGLKKYYTKIKDTVKINVVNEILQYETKVSNALGNKLLLVNRNEIQPYSVTQSAKEDAVEEKPTVINQPAIVVSEKPEASPTSAEIIVPMMAVGAMPEAYTASNSYFPSLTPVIKPKAKITSPFGFRLHPILKKQVKHNGVDFGSGRGVDVFAAGDGRVVLAEFSNSFGNYVVVEHSDGLSTVYAHMESINVSKGSAVVKGQLLGITGSTGRSTAPHLHYEVRVSGTPINPADYLKEVR